MLHDLHIGRRTLLQHALVLAGAASTASFSAEALAKAASQPQRYLGKSAFATLSAIADIVIPVTDTPGALAAKVPESLDALLANWASPETRDLVTTALIRVETAAQAQTGKPFASLAAADRNTFLTAHDKAALEPVPPPPGSKPGNLFAPVISVTDNGYYRIKDMIITLYYLSEIALTQELTYEHVPGEWVPSLKITPGMRPFAGTGPF